MNNKTLIILVAIGLIFFYWRKKRGKMGMSCAGLWDNMSNPKAESFFINKMVEISNNPDLKASITQQFPQFGYEYGKCVYTANWMSKAIEPDLQSVLPMEHQLLSSVEISKVKDCICEKLKNK
mgnify:CR=1 FL=1|tara:strand:- start:3266 stop:3634 length:369 start_codon:yes stop_codon:yes gene_type:complete